MSSDRDLLAEGIEHFNAGRFFEAHEVWEDLWRATDGDAKLYYQGLIQAAVGLYHVQRGNEIGARSQIEKAVTKLERYPFDYGEIDNRGLIACLKAAFGAVARGESNLAARNVRIRRL